MENEKKKPQKSERPGGGGYDITRFMLSGVFKVECVPEKRAYFGQGQIMYIDLDTLFCELANATCKNQQLVEDFKKYESSLFSISVVGVYFKEEERKAALEAAKAAWEGELY